MMNQHILMSEGKKNVIVSPSTKAAEKFIKQINTLFKVKTFNKINHFPFLYLKHCRFLVEMFLMYRHNRILKEDIHNK